MPGGYVAGVAAGWGERFGVDPLFIRLGLVIATMWWTYEASAPALVPTFYLLAWLTMAPRGGRAVLGRIGQRAGFQEAAGAGLVWVAVIVMLTRPGAWLVLGLVGLAWILLNPRRDDGPGAGTAWSAGSVRVMGEGVAAPGTGVAAPGTGVAAPGTGVAAPGTGMAAPGTGVAAQGEIAGRWSRSRDREWGRPRLSASAWPGPRPGRTKREPALWPLTMALLAFFLIAFVTFDSVRSPGLPPSLAVNGALLIIGGVIILSAWRGRALGTIVLAVPLIVPWIAFSVADIGRFQGEGMLRVTPTEVPEDGQLAYERGYGGLQVDLTSLPLEPGQVVVLTTEVTAGGTEVVVPADAEITVVNRLGVGGASVVSPEWGRADTELGLARQYRRVYPALGRWCHTWMLPWEQMVEYFEVAGVRTGRPDNANVNANANGDNADGDNADGSVDPPADEDRTAVLEAIVAAGYPLPRFGWREPAPGLSGPGEDEGAPVRDVEYWEFASDGRGRPCIPSDPPDNPSRIQIHSTVGLGALRVVRQQSAKPAEMVQEEVEHGN